MRRYFLLYFNLLDDAHLIYQVSEHASKIEKAQKELEAAIEAAKAETQAAIDKRMNNAKENKDVQLEVSYQVPGP